MKRALGLTFLRSRAGIMPQAQDIAVLRDITHGVEGAVAAGLEAGGAHQQQIAVR